MRAHDGEQALGVLPGTDRDQLAFVGDVQRIESKELARCVDLRLHGNGRLADQHADIRLPRKFVQRGAQPAAGGVAQAADGRHGLEHFRHEAVQRCGVRLDRGLEAQVLAQRHDGHAMVADRARHEDRVARSRPVAGNVDPVRHDPEPGGRDEHAIALALLDDLGVAGNDRHTGLPRRGGHRLDDALQVRQRKAFLEDEAGGEANDLV